MSYNAPSHPDDLPTPHNLDPEQIRALALNGATDEEIADLLRCSMTDLAPFEAELKQARAQRRLLIRKKQTAAAADGSASMLTFLGRSELGQCSKPTEESPDDPWPQPQLDPKVG